MLRILVPGSFPQLPLSQKNMPRLVISYKQPGDRSHAPKPEYVRRLFERLLQLCGLNEPAQG
jgi:hypothetical protein